MQQFLTFGFNQLADLNVRPAGNDLRDLFLINDLLNHVFFFLALRCFTDFAFQRWNCIILQLGRFLIAGFVLRLGKIQPGFFQQFLIPLGLIQLSLFLLPLIVFDFFLFFQISQFFTQLFQPLQRLGIGFLLQRCFFNFQLHDSPHQLIQLGRHRIHLHPQGCASFINQIDCLIRQKPVGDISVGQRGCGNNRFI